MKRFIGKDLMGFVPVYVDLQGDCTAVLVQGSEPHVLNESMESVTNSVFQAFQMSMADVKDLYKDLLAVKNLIPIPLGRKDVFVALKTRIPRCHKDRAFGYINLRHIRELKQDGNHTIILLSDGSSIRSYTKLSTVRTRISVGTMLSKCYQERSIPDEECPSCDDSSAPATKGDIIMIKEKLEEFLLET